MPAKAIFIFVCPFVTLAQDCAVSFAPRQLLKGAVLRKNGGLSDLFGVAEEALLGDWTGVLSHLRYFISVR